MQKRPLSVVTLFFLSTLAGLVLQPSLGSTLNLLVVQTEEPPGIHTAFGRRKPFLDAFLPEGPKLEIFARNLRPHWCSWGLLDAGRGVHQGTWLNGSEPMTRTEFFDVGESRARLISI